MKKFRVVYERDPSKWWVARVANLKGCHTQGRTIDQARDRIREALALYVEDADTVELVDVVKLPSDVNRQLAAYRSARSRAVKEQERAQSCAKSVVKILTGKMRLSVRDTGKLLGLSHQRVQQLLHG